ncbi:DUF5329 family protein [Pseudoxanthomonas sp. 10H]|uniref:DUF5329 family protein n=1 Tax=Pseudoxanthomonas sp. 10H TaxID=3242729 RepID=UPI003558B17B
MLASAAPALAQPSAGQALAEAEIEALIAGLGDSGCRFQRNGRWHGAAEAQAHLRRKYEWGRRGGEAGSAEAFIDRAASRSSVTGRAYRVSCTGQPEADAAEWFRARLADLRASTPAR